MEKSWGKNKKKLIKINQTIANERGEGDRNLKNDSRNKLLFRKTTVKISRKFDYMFVLSIS